MLKILFVSHIEVFGYGGGALENRKYYDGLKNYTKNIDAELKIISLDKKNSSDFGITIKKNRIDDILARLLGHSTYLYIIWKKNKKKIYEYNPNIIVLGRSRMGFIAKDIKKEKDGCYVITNMENVEYDYVDAYFANKRGIKKHLLSTIEKYGVYNDEKAAVYYSDALNYLTKRDLVRTHEVYRNKAEFETILPICIDSDVELKIMSGVKNIVYIGSLDYASNIEAIKWFINEVWDVYCSKDIELQFIIGGSNPKKELVELVKDRDNILIYKDFTALEDIIPRHSMIIAPIQSGAGMKVKVAEALSMGLLIAASEEALVGYEEALNNIESEGIIRANSSKEYVDAINKYKELSEEKLKDIEKNNRKLYHQLYSYNRSRKTIFDMLQKVIKGK